MGTSTDPVFIYVATHTKSPDGTTRNDTYYATTTLTNYTADLVNFATPIWNSVSAERTAVGAALGNSANSEPVIAGTASGGPVNLVTRVNVGVQPLATPIRYHRSAQSVLSDNQITSATDIYNWLTGIVAQQSVINIYPQVNY